MEVALGVQNGLGACTSCRDRTKPGGLWNPQTAGRAKHTTTMPYYRCASWWNDTLWTEARASHSRIRGHVYFRTKIAPTIPQEGRQQLLQVLDRLEDEAEQEQEALRLRIDAERLEVKATMTFSRASAIKSVEQQVRGGTSSNSVRTQAETRLLVQLLLSYRRGSAGHACENREKGE